VPEARHCNPYNAPAIKSGNFSAEDAKDAELLWRSTLDCGGCELLRAFALIKQEEFSAKDAKDAKIDCFIALTVASNNYCGKFFDQAG